MIDRNARVYRVRERIAFVAKLRRGTSFVYLTYFDTSLEGARLGFLAAAQAEGDQYRTDCVYVVPFYAGVETLEGRDYSLEDLWYSARTYDDVGRRFKPPHDALHLAERKVQVSVCHAELDAAERLGLERDWHYPAGKSPEFRGAVDKLAEIVSVGVVKTASERYTKERTRALKSAS